MKSRVILIAAVAILSGFIVTNTHAQQPQQSDGNACGSTTQVKDSGSESAKVEIEPIGGISNLWLGPQRTVPHERSLEWDDGRTSLCLQ